MKAGYRQGKETETDMEHLARKLRCNRVVMEYGTIESVEEEFFVILPETGREEAVGVANRLMVAVRSHTFLCDGHQTHITVSIGGALFPDQSRDKMGLIKRADKALYRAKEMGRDRVIFGSESPQIKKNTNEK